MLAVVWEKVGSSIKNDCNLPEVPEGLRQVVKKVPALKWAEQGDEKVEKIPVIER